MIFKNKSVKLTIYNSVFLGAFRFFFKTRLDRPKLFIEQLLDPRTHARTRTHAHTHTHTHTHTSRTQATFTMVWYEALNSRFIHSILQFIFFEAVPLSLLNICIF